MPYIKQDDRKQYLESLDMLTDDIDEMGFIAGHVTYVLYMIVARWFKREPSYDTICKIRGCLIGTMTEFDRRIAAPYEDTKIRENGDVNASARAQCIHLAYDCEVCVTNSRVPEPEACEEDEYGRCMFNNDTRGGA
jgi:hypothetical protein